MSFICLGFGCFTGTISDCLCQNDDIVVSSNCVDAKLRQEVSKDM